MEKMLKSCVFWMCSVILILSSNGQFYKCPKICICNTHYIYKTDCSNHGLTELPGNVSDQVQILDLTLNHFSTMPANISVFAKLEVLSLRHNRIRVLGKDALQGLSELKKLDLSQNYFARWSDIHADILRPAVLLDYLDLSHNPLLEFPRLSSYSLEELYLKNCSIEKMYNNITELMPNLQILDLEYNTFQTVQEMLSASLTNLNMGNCYVRSVLSNAFTKTPSLKVLNLKENSHLKFLHIVSKSIERLDISHCNFEEIPNAELPNLQFMDISENHVNKIPSNAFKNMSKITDIYMLFNNLEYVDKDAFIDAVNLNVIDLSYNTITNLDPNTFKNCLKLNNLIISRNYITHLVPFDIKNLQHLDFSECEINYISADSLNNMPALTTLKLSKNVFTSIPSNFSGKNIQRLDLSYGRVLNLKTDSFRKMPSLLSLNLIGNRLVELRREVLHDISSVKISDNPWRCDCENTYFHQLYTTLTTRISSDVEITACQSPEKYEGVYWHDACEAQWSMEEARITRAWMYSLGFIGIFCILVCVIMSVNKKRKNRERDIRLDREISDAREVMQRMRDAEINIEETVNYNAPDPKLENPPSYNEALSMERLAASSDSLNRTAMGSNRSINNAERKHQRRRRKRRRSKSSASEEQGTSRQDTVRDSESSDHQVITHLESDV